MTVICLVTERVALLTPIDCNVAGLFFDSSQPPANRNVIVEVELTFVRDVGVSIQCNVGYRIRLADQIRPRPEVLFHDIQRGIAFRT